MPERSDVVVVGGGTAGCSVAYYLARAGVKVTLVERAGIGMQASGYSAGGLNPLHGFLPTLRPLALESFGLHRMLWDDLQQATGRNCQQRIISMLMVAYDAAELSGLQETLDVYQATPGFTAHWLDPTQVRELEPRLTPDLVGGLYLHGNGVVDSHLFTGLLAETAQQAGVTIREGNVCGLQHRHGHITAVVLEEGTIACDQVVLAMGPWTKAAEPWLGCAIPIEPMKGEILRMELPGTALAHDCTSTDILLCSRPGPQIWCASTEEWCGFDTTLSDSARQALWQRAARLMPVMAEARLLQQTACLRPVAPDWLPIIGRAPEWDNVYLATGGAKKGILFSTGIGKAIADLITTGSTPLSIERCSPARFAQVSASD
jgi:glycine oxidase